MKLFFAFVNTMKARKATTSVKVSRQNIYIYLPRVNEFSPYHNNGIPKIS